MRGQYPEPPVDARVSRSGLRSLDRWMLAPIAIGIVFAAIQVLHTFEMLYYGILGVILEAVVPLVLALLLAVTGPWLSGQGYRANERGRMVGWMALVALLVGLLFAWALSHHLILGYSFPHADYVMTTNLIAGSLLGLLVGIYDVTSRRRRRAVEAERETVTQQRARLSVLNRVLRHNLRNDMNAVTGYAELLEEQPADAEGYLARIREVADDLVSIGEKAREIEAVVASQREHRSASLPAVVQGAVESVQGSYPDCTIEVGTVVDRPVNETVLTPVLKELVENACRHQDADNPVVNGEASVGDEADTVTIRVADNGPSIPDHELAPIREGAETVLEHGSGLGIWLVQWGVTALGGDVRFAENEPRGSRVTLRFPSVG